MANGNSGGKTNFGMQPSGAASDRERPEGTSMTDREQTKGKPRSQQEVQMGDKAPQPGERAEQEQAGQSSPQRQRTPLHEGSEGYEAPGEKS